MSNDSAVTDAELVERARREDATAFDALVRRYLRAAYALALSLTHDHHDAEDVCQEACARSLAHLGECRTPARFAGWFFAIVRSAALHWQRRERVRRTESLDVHEHANADDPGRDAERTELRARLAAALGTLDRPECDVVLLHDMEGWTHGAIGEALGISEVNSRQLLFVARRKLRKALGNMELHRTAHD